MNHLASCDAGQDVLVDQLFDRITKCHLYVVSKHQEQTTNNEKHKDGIAWNMGRKDSAKQDLFSFFPQIK